MNRPMYTESIHRTRIRQNAFACGNRFANECVNGYYPLDRLGLADRSAVIHPIFVQLSSMHACVPSGIEAFMLVKSKKSSL